ncbi:hypothetical protein ASPBRDRAFT_190366 [Aspergillus brasiliensis CBS 101740]|uniref:Uncharacterized protein n=1 Tax=Aspergillus brasiliensis (strain CBS 101740 / IMI 381727 / IBT 21946) TaxID=767769 RepID=A0A1L9UZB9_ASPBC|nr:hypothetical protein ASPBRDRAFT_190366 [Aspergillus brasiliensis CBS 101740]
MYLNEDPFTSGRASGSWQHGDSETRKRSPYGPNESPQPPLYLSAEKKRRLSGELNKLKEALFNALGGTTMQYDDSEDNVSSDNLSLDRLFDVTPSAGGLSSTASSEDSAWDDRWSDTERLDEDFFGNGLFDGEASGDGSHENKGFWHWLCDIFSTAWESTKDAVGSVFRSIESAVARIWDVVSDLGSWVKDILENFVSRFMQIFKGGDQQEKWEYIPML